ncbi:MULTISPECIES: hypothetical protein [unclassified Streptomyces]|uniref:hypothetical protein n=1 Tax=unclassified Streptomyces TaxID=2593676 RepID=UPI003823C630
MAMQLVDDTGFDPYDAGTPADSWRQQPNSPVYCTELTLDALPAALAAADRAKDVRVRNSLPERFAALVGAEYYVGAVQPCCRADDSGRQ